MNINCLDRYILSRPTTHFPFAVAGAADLVVDTEVNASFDRVVSGFGAPLFGTLNPPFPRARLLRMDGNRAGHRIELLLDFGLFTQKWTGIISAHAQSTDLYWFVDRGEQLPFFLRSWEHYHGIREVRGGVTLITDAIRFRSAPWIPRFLMRWMLIRLMRYRSPRYNRYFVLC